ncbi:MAG TPA: nucleotidyl transferase AbiEii/AbiGii toxin family protein [Polyangiales bacterium]
MHQLRKLARDRLAAARVRVRVDVGFGDAITPAATTVDFPTLLDLPAPRLRVYPRETVIVEKLEAMVQLGIDNSRMKDFYDVALLARDFDFDGELIARAIRATFDRRGTVLPLLTPIALTTDFAHDPSKRTQWAAFVRKADVPDAGTLVDVTAAVRGFLAEPLNAVARGVAFTHVWSAGSPWNEKGR